MRTAWRAAPAAPAAAVLVAAGLLAAGTPSAAQEARGFAAWIAACDNLRACTAIGLPAPEGGPALVLRRSGEAGAPPLLTLVFPEGGAAPAGPLRLLIDGAPVAGVEDALPLEDAAAAARRVVLPADATRALLAAMPRGRRLDVALNVDRAPLAVSLVGAGAALLWLDAHQRRTGTPNAMVRRGTADGPPAPPALPVLVRAAEPVRPTASAAAARPAATARASSSAAERAAVSPAAAVAAEARAGVPLPPSRADVLAPPASVARAPAGPATDPVRTAERPSPASSPASRDAASPAVAPSPPPPPVGGKHQERADDADGAGGRASEAGALGYAAAPRPGAVVDPLAPDATGDAPRPAEARPLDAEEPDADAPRPVPGPVPGPVPDAVAPSAADLPSPAGGAAPPASVEGASSAAVEPAATSVPTPETPAAVLAPRPAPVPRDLPPPVRAAAAAQRECGRPPAAAPSLALGRGVTLWAVPCGTGGVAPAAAFFLEAPGGVRRAVFPRPRAGDEFGPDRALNVLVNARLDERTLGVESLAPLRETGDCGVAAAWAWTGDGFGLLRYAALDACRGLKPTDWPVLYRAALRAAP